MIIIILFLILIVCILNLKQNNKTYLKRKTEPNDKLEVLGVQKIDSYGDNYVVNLVVVDTNTNHVFMCPIDKLEKRRK